MDIWAKGRTSSWRQWQRQVCGLWAVSPNLRPPKTRCSCHLTHPRKKLIQGWLGPVCLRSQGLQDEGVVPTILLGQTHPTFNQPGEAGHMQSGGGEETQQCRQNAHPQQGVQSR